MPGSNRRWRLWPQATGHAVVAALGAAALTFAVLPTAASADHVTVNDEGDRVPAVRWAGETRYDTAAKLAVEGTSAATSTPATAAILATGENFPDALAGAYLSGQVGGPILLTEQDQLPAETRTRLTSDEDSGLTEVETVYLLGGPIAISEAVEQELESLDFDVVRIAGADRIETAADIATEAPDGTVGEVDGLATAIVARADNFPDALVTGAAARNAQLPLLLTNTNDLPQVTIDALDELGIEQVLLPGGPVAISQDVEDELGTLGYETVRFDGATRQDTAVQFAEFSIDTLAFTSDEIGLARGDFYPDALTIAPFAGREGFPVVLTDSPTVLGTESATFLAEQASCTSDTLYIPGGPVAVSADVEALARDAYTTDDDCAAVDNDDPIMTGAIVSNTEDTVNAGRVPPAPTDDVAQVYFDEPVTGDDLAETAPGQFIHVADDGTETPATSVDYDESVEVTLGFPGGTLTEGEGAIEYRQSGVRSARVTDLAGNEATNVVTVEIATETEVDSTADAVDAAIGDGECATADGECTLRAAVQEANADPDVDIITLAPGTYALDLTGADEDAAATGDLDVTENVILRGDGETAADTIVDGAALEDRLFDVTADVTIVDAMTLQNGAAQADDDRGGAIRQTEGRLTVTDAAFLGNTAPQAGGAIENTGGDLGVFDGVFTGNTTGTTPGNGGAIHAAGGTTFVQTSSFDDNVAEAGGAVWVGGGELMLDTSTFTANEALGGTTDAGARQGGGAVFGVDAVVGDTNGIYTDNVAVGGEGDGAGSGGAIMSTTTEGNAGSLSVVGAVFTTNTADRAGGAIENDGTSVLTVTDTTFTDNVATGEDSAGNGGAIHTIAPAVVGGTTDANLASGNTADEGGAFWVGGGATLDVMGTTFDANVAVGDEGVVNGGGALFNIGATLLVDGATFTANDASGNAGSGGAIMSTGIGAATAATTTVSSSTFTGNTADRAGGAIENNGLDTETETNAGSVLTVTGSDFDGNSVAGGDTGPGNGGAIHDGGGTTTVNGGTADNNAAVNGGAFWVGGDGTMTVTDTTLDGNDADAGSTLYVQAAGALTIDGITATTTPPLVPLDPVPALLQVEDGGTVDATAGDNSLDDGDDAEATCSTVVGDTTNGNTDDDGTCFTDPGR